MAAIWAWLRSHWDPKDIVQSRELVKKLNLPESTSQFVLALRPSDAPNSVVYVLSSLYLSERAASDARQLIQAADPKAVVCLVDLEAIDSFREEDKVRSEGKEKFVVPTSSLGVIRENLVRDPEVVPYESRARIEVARSMFGTGMFSDVLVAREAAAKLDASFHYIDYPYRSISDVEDDASVAANGTEGGSQEISQHSQEATKIQQSDALNFAATRRAAQGLKNFVEQSPLDELREWRESCSVALSQMFGHNKNWSASKPTSDSSGDSEVPLQPAEDEVSPNFVKPLLPLLDALFLTYQTPALRKAWLHATKMFENVEKGQEVNPSDLMEASRFRIALEMSRVRINKKITESAGKIPNRTAADFHNLSYEEQSLALLAQSLQKEAREKGTVVAVVDVNRVSGIRQQWNQPIPEEVIPFIDECYISMDDIEEVNILETLFRTDYENSKQSEARQEKKAAAVVGAGAAAAVGLAFLPNWAAPFAPIVKLASAQATTLFKIGFLNSKRALALTVAKTLPGASKIVLPVKASVAKSASASAAKAVLSAEKAQAAAQGLVSGLQRQTLQAIRTSFYSAMRGTNKRSAWLLFGGSVVSGTGILLYGNEMERTLGAVPSASIVARLGRGLESLSQAVQQIGLNWDEVYNEVYNMNGNLS